MRGVAVAGLLALGAGLFSGCAHFRDPPPRPPPGPEDSLPGPNPPPGPPLGPPGLDAPGPEPSPSSRTLFLIHGDADYTYHDAHGNRLRADLTALGEARAVARSAVRGEVLIFHQRTGRWGRFWGASGGSFEHYRFGNLVERGFYRRSAGSFAGESAQLRDRGLLVGLSGVPVVLAYFGHEIPPEEPGEAAGGAPSDDGVLTVARFARGLENLAARPPAPADLVDGAEKPYRLIVLSTCNGGTPTMMKALAPLADYAVASPARLHLSHMDARALGALDRLDSIAARESWKSLADSVAIHSFARLKKNTLTEITVGVYNLEKTSPFVASAPARPMPAAPEATNGEKAEEGTAWRDCGAAPGFDSSRARQGVTLFYRAPRFGPEKDVTARSAWQCEVTAQRLPAK